ncbi:MAG TPA: translation elongation factor Ts, partial [Gaiellaceae bacterium]
MTPDVPAKLVKQLRDETGAPMMDAKRALQETNLDFEEAKRWLRERGMAQAAKRADRATKEGLVGYRIAGQKGTIVAVGCETEPVSKSEEFQAYAEKVLRAVHDGGVEAAATLEDERVELSAK